MSTLEVDQDPAGAMRSIVEEARKAVEQDHAEVICLGCAGMAGLEDAITSELGVPVIDGVGAAVRFAEAVVGLGLKTSKVSTYAKPNAKRIIGWPLSEALGLRPRRRSGAARGRPSMNVIGKTKPAEPTDAYAMPGLKENFAAEVDLASRWLGGSVLAASDESFGEKESLLTPTPSAFVPGQLWAARRDRGWLGDQAPERTRARLGVDPAGRGGHRYGCRCRYQLLHR